jgi:hypothetical protein
LWWNQLFGKQEDIIKNWLQADEWMYEWSWPQRHTLSATIVSEGKKPKDQELLEKVTRRNRIMYSGQRKKDILLETLMT